jgi:hypothetical protein
MIACAETPPAIESAANTAALIVLFTLGFVKLRINEPRFLRPRYLSQTNLRPIYTRPPHTRSPVAKPPSAAAQLASTYFSSEFWRHVTSFFGAPAGFVGKVLTVTVAPNDRIFLRLVVAP